MPRLRTLSFAVFAVLIVCAAVLLGTLSPATATTEEPGQGRDGTVTAEQAPTTPQAARVKELVELRTDRSKIFELADGQREWVGYVEAVHYKDAGGAFKEIDNGIVSENKQVDGVDWAYRNAANAYTVRFALNGDASHLVSIEAQGKSISFGPLGTRTSDVAKTAELASKVLSEETYGESVITYRDSLPGIDLVYQPRTYGVKEYIVLRQPGTQDEYTFNLILKGLSVKQADGQVSFVDSEGKTVFVLGDPVAFDDAEAWTNDVTYRVEESGGTCQVTIIMPRAYLDDPARVYPVVIDPEIMYPSPTADTYVASNPNYDDTNFSSSSYLRTGRDTPYSIRRSFLKFDQVDNLPISGDQVTDAYIRIQEYSRGTSAPTINAWYSLVPYAITTMTWNGTAPGTPTPHWDGGSTDDFGSPQSTLGSQSGTWWTMHVTTPVQYWLNGTYPNHGWMIKDTTENNTSHWTTFYASNAGSPHMPELHVVYTPSVYPSTYLASLHFDGPDWGDGGEKTFPMQGSGTVGTDAYPRLIKTDVDYNGDGYVDVEEAIQMYVPWATGSGIYGTTRDGHTISQYATVKADQRPAVYWQQRAVTAAGPSWTVYQYWLYYPDNDWANNHEHDWEHYDLYFCNGVLHSTKVSWHNTSFQDHWSDWVLNGLVEDGTHLKLSVQGGSHGITGAGGGLEDGVEIKWTGAVYSHGARLDMVGTGGWRIFSNDWFAGGITGYSEAGSHYNSSYYYYDDPLYGGGEWLSGNLAPWLRPTYLVPDDPI